MTSQPKTRIELLDDELAADLADILTREPIIDAFRPRVRR